jgi:chromate transporter
LGKVVLFPNEFSVAGLDVSFLAWTIISFVALYRFKVNTILWIGCSAVFGVVILFFTINEKQKRG